MESLSIRLNEFNKFLKSIRPHKIQFISCRHFQKALLISKPFVLCEKGPGFVVAAIILFKRQRNFANSGEKDLAVGKGK